jgi:hypothetical protein
MVSKESKEVKPSKGYHYSIFRLFSKKEFNRSMEIFKRNIIMAQKPIIVLFIVENYSKALINSCCII